MLLKKLMCSASLMSLMLLPVTAEAGMKTDFVPPSHQTDSLRINLPDSVDIITLTGLGVELNGVDITALLSLDGTDFIYMPVEPYQPGSHNVRLVAFENGKAVEQAGWSFVIEGGDEALVPTENQPDMSQQQMSAAESWLRGGSVDSDTLIEVSNRSLDNNLDNAPDRSILSGGGDLQVRQESDQWTVQARTNYLMQSDPDLRLTDNAVDIGEYNLSADYTGQKYTGGVTLGHHDIGYDSLLVSNFYRRGVSARIGMADDRARATGFSFSPQSLSGGQDFTGLSDSADRIQGLATSFKPFGKDMDALEITGLYYSGEGSDGGNGISESDIVSSGSGWGVGFDKGFADRRATVRGEFAQTEFDPDGDQALVGEDTSEAVSVMLEGRPFAIAPVWNDKQADIVTGVQYERIGTFFESLANPSMASDREAYKAYGNLYWGALSGGLEIVQETNNVDDVASAPTDRLRSLSLYSSYHFDKQTGEYEWLGTPYINVNGYMADLQRQETPSGYTGSDTDNNSESLTLGGGSSYEQWYWAASHTVSQFNDHAAVANDTINHYTSLNGGWEVSERINIDGGLQFGALRDRDDATNIYDTNFSLGVRADLVPEKWNLNLDYNLNLSSGNTDTPDVHLINSEVEYTLIQPRINRPGMAVAIRGTMENRDGSTTDNDTEYQIFTVLRVKAPFSFGY